MAITNKLFDVKNGLSVANTIVLSNTSGVLNISNINTLTVTQNTLVANITATQNCNVSNISATGNIVGNNLVVTTYVNVGNISATATMTAQNLIATVNAAVTNLFSGNVAYNSSAWAGIYSIYASQNANNFGSVGIQNRYGPGANASADFVAISDDGSDTAFYIDLGINNSSANDALYPTLGKRDSYLIGSGNAINTSNMTIGTLSQGSNVQFIVGGNANSNISMWLSPVTGGGANLRLVGNISTNQNIITTQNVTTGNVSVTTLSNTSLLNASANIYTANVFVTQNIQMANGAPIYFGGGQANVANALFSISYNVTANSLDFLFI